MLYWRLKWTTAALSGVLLRKKKNIDKIAVLQKAALRHIARIDRMSSTRDLFPNFNIIRFEHHYNYRFLNWFFFSPCDSKNFLISIVSLRPHDTAVDIRDPAPWFVPRFRTQYKMQTLKHNLPVLLTKYKNESMVSRKRLREHFTNLPYTSEVFWCRKNCRKIIVWGINCVKQIYRRKVWFQTFGSIACVGFCLIITCECLIILRWLYLDCVQKTKRVYVKFFVHNF